MGLIEGGVLLTSLLKADPKITGPLLIALLFFPDKIQSIIPIRIAPYLKSPGLIRTLGGIFTLGIARKINAILSFIVLNNWNGSAKFEKSKELVLISGGSGGIGSLIAKNFAGLGVKVVIVDLFPPKEVLCM
jgi:all-trans-retinol dehydrogenase (NAD+)